MGWNCPIYLPAFKNTGLQFLINIHTRDVQTMPINDDGDIYIYENPARKIFTSLPLHIHKRVLYYNTKYNYIKLTGHGAPG